MKSPKLKKGIYYVFVTGSGVKIENYFDDQFRTANFSSYCGLLDYLKIHNIRYRVLQNKWDIEVY